MPFTLTSPAFAEGETIPVRFTCDGENVSPPLAWSDAPEGTRSFTLVMHDPDTPRGDIVHWLLFDIPAHAAHLPEGVLDEGTPGTNERLSIGYMGPCPPPGSKPHRYQFEFYALSAERLGLDDSATREAVENAFENHILAQTTFTGLYARQGA